MDLGTRPVNSNEKEAGEGQEQTHSSELIKLNRVVIKKSSNQDLLKKVMSKETCESLKPEEQNKLFEETPTIKKCRKDKYKVINPYLTKTTWDEIQKNTICPVKLVQFLRMNSGLAEEGDYNELYHLSNCKCSTNGGWNYVVGDRIESPTNHKIELFDVMAFNKNKKKIFYLHVKHKFDAGAARNLCSQVKVGIKCLWDTLMAYSDESNMVGKFYDVAMSKESSDHVDLTQEEVKKLEILKISL